MTYQPGKYIICKKAHWTKTKAAILTITQVDVEGDEITYFYDADEEVKLSRSFDDFEHILLVPCSPLIEELF